jgi:hypothetical protein
VLPIAVFPAHTMRRISAQRSCFTLHGSGRRGFATEPGPIRGPGHKKIMTLLAGLSKQSGYYLKRHPKGLTRRSDK